jgi:hypothetical protein
MENRFGIERGRDYVPVGKRRTIAGMGEQIAAEERLGRFFEQKPCLPIMRNVRSIDVPNALATEIDDLAIGQLAGRSITQIIERNQATKRTVRDLGSRRGSEKFVHRPALVRLHVPKRNPPDSRERNDARYCFGYEWKHSPWTRVKEQRLLGVNKELIEREPARRGVRDAG